MPTETTDPAAPSFDVLQGGAVFLELALITDPDAGLAVALGSADGFPLCGKPFTEFRLLDFLIIGSRTDPLRDPDEPDAHLPGRLIQTLLNGHDAFARVYSLDGDIVDTCEFLLNGTILAEGRVHLVATDNDVDAFKRSEPIRANAFGFMVHGEVKLTTGGVARLNATYRAVFFPPDEVKEGASRIQLIGAP